MSARVKCQFCILSHFSSLKPRKGSCFCKVPLGGVLESENWGLRGFSLILEMGPSVRFYLPATFQLFHQLDSHQKLKK